MTENWIEPTAKMPRPMRGRPERSSDDGYVTLHTRFLLADRESVDFDVSAWIAHRMEIFEKFTVPSVLGSARLPDVWFLTISDWVLELVPELVTLAERHPFVHIEIVHEGQSRAAMTSEWLASHESDWTDRGYMLSARLDNDDAIASDFFSLANDWIRLKPHPVKRPTVLSFPYGLQYVEEDNSVRVRNKTNNHFTLILQPCSSSPMNVYLNHSWLFTPERLSTAPVDLLVTRQAMWLEVVHGSNLLNHVDCGEAIDVARSDFSLRFGVEVGV